jgi:signal transduction histidine kinase/CheY-like chemotaxis protein
MNQNLSAADYLAPNIAELAQQRGGGGDGIDPLAKSKGEGHENHMTRSVARRLLPACVVVPALVWGLLFLGVHLHWYALETAFVLFVFSVTVVFGVIVCLNLKRLSRLDVQRARAEEQLKTAKEAAEAANRFKSAFFANISHEIRTPLTAINGFAELLLNPERSEEQRLDDARVIRRNGEHLLALINDILDLSKIEAGKMSVEQILCCPVQIIGDVCSMLRHRASEKGLTLDVKFDGPIPKMIRTDPTRLRQVLINLTANAVKFTKEGGVRLTVAIKPSLRVAKPVLEIKITDTGIGIPADRVGSLFQPFVQGDATVTRQYGGSGLGLAISRHFSRALGGDIAVTSEQGQGSTFTVTVGTGALVDAAIHENPQKAMEVEREFAGQRVRIVGSVLVAEDGIDNQALIAAKLSETGLKLEMVSNGQQALEKALDALAKGTPYDVIFMDVQMPVMDGYTATLQLRSKGYRGPIIALTANAMERDRTKLLNAGCNDFVTKPIQMDKLFKAIGKYLKVTAVTAEPATKAAIVAPAAPVNHAMQVQKFYQDLPAELEQIEQAIERQDRVQLKEVAQLLLGKAATAGLKEIAPQAAKLMQSAEFETSWILLQQAADEFAREARPTQEQRQAA